MSRLLFIALASLALPAPAKPWKGITPGTSTMDDVFVALGEPTKKSTQGESETWVYGKAMIQGTLQAQVHFARKAMRVTRIDVYPAPKLDEKAIEKAYGPPCKTVDEKQCYVRKETAKKEPYFVYTALGLAVFFTPEGDRVKSLAFLPGQGPSEGGP